MILSAFLAWHSSAAADPENARLLAETALAAFESGDRAAAEKNVQAALALDGNELLARLLQAELFRTAGRIDEARTAYAWLVRFHNDEQNETFASPDSLRWIGLAAARLAEWNRNADDFKFLVAELYPAALKRNKDYWPAHYEMGRLFLQKYNYAEAERQFSAALALNPAAAEVHAAIARLALLTRDLKKAAISADRAIEINPRILAAWHVKADLLWANFDVEGARRLLDEKALPLNPRDEETLGRLAACHFMLAAMPENNQAAKSLAQITAAVEARNPRAADFYFQLAAWLDDRHRIEAAERYYARARQLMPDKTGPAAALAMLYLRDGREDDARRLLADAAQNDPFNVRTANSLELFHVIDSLQSLETADYFLRFDPARDELLGRYAAKYLAEIYPQLCKQFGYRPTRPPLVEIFNAARGQSGHSWFGVRMTGLPYVGPVAACSGRVVAMTSPYDPAVTKRFNWARVLKHELVHFVTLQQTNFNIPHWFTEGLAVRAENYPRPQEWNRLLCRRLDADDLYTLDTINFAFTRPDSCEDWQMAYCQAELYVDYILGMDDGAEQIPSPRINAMLAAYTQNLSTADVIKSALGMTQEQFESGFRKYVADIAAAIRGLPGNEPPPPFEKLLDRHRQNLERQKPSDADVAAQLALAYYLRGMTNEAAHLAAGINATDPKNPLAAYVLARLALGVNRADAAFRLLETAHDPDRPHPLVIELLAELKIKAAQSGIAAESPATLYAAAEQLYRLGNRREPHNPSWLRRLARVHLLANNEPELAKCLVELAQIDADDSTIRIKLALLANNRQDYAASTRWAKEALHIDVLSPTAHRAFAEALLGRHNYQMAIDEFETAIRLEEKTENDQR